MDKLAEHEKIAALKQARETILALDNENRLLREKVAAYEKRERTRKLAGAMASKGLIDSAEMEKKAEELVNEPDLEVVEKAVSLVKEGSVKLGSVSSSATFSEGDGDEITAALSEHVMSKGGSPS